MSFKDTALDIARCKGLFVKWGCRNQLDLLFILSSSLQYSSGFAHNLCVSWWSFPRLMLLEGVTCSWRLAGGS